MSYQICIQWEDLRFKCNLDLYWKTQGLRYCDDTFSDFGRVRVIT